MFTRILFATDGSLTSEHALKSVANLAGYGSTIRVVTVVGTHHEAEISPASFLTAREPVEPSTLVETGQKENTLAIEAGEGILESTKAQLNEPGVTVDTQLLLFGLSHPDVPSAILKAAEDWAADVIVVGTHGRTGLQRVMLGSVAETLARHCKVPVLLVRAPHQE
ncbi:universal stress protein [Neisseriaceae bacterium JH1-16]|nr:universal stress protein [Neisseriaceae bacterium JH1-16]